VLGCFRYKKYRDTNIIQIDTGGNPHPEYTSLFSGRVSSLRRTGRTSADVVTGRDGLSLPPGYALRSLADLLLPTGVYVYSGC